MRGPINKLTDTKIESKLKVAKKAASEGSGKAVLLGDGGGLTLQINKRGTSSWLYRFMRQGKATALGLGPYPAVSLKTARDKAAECRKIIAEGKDPLEQKRSTEQRASASTAHTFSSCASDYIAAHLSEWRSSKHAKQWESTLATYAFPVVGELAMDRITTAEVTRILDPIWNTKRETASRLRGRIEAIIDWATAHEIRQGDNPARWKGHLEHLLAKSTTANRVAKHHAALPHAAMPTFMTRLAAQDGMSRWALEFLILTAARTSEVTGAVLEEIDFEKGLWTVPASRMKAGKEHRVPLSPQALAVLAAARPLMNGSYLFPGGTRNKGLSNMAMTMLVRRMGYADITVHGFRSTFRDFAAEMTAYDFTTAEEALAHRLRDKVAAAYARTDLYDKRAPLMRDWAEYCYSDGKNSRLQE